MNPYEVLNLSPDAAPADIRAAHRTLVMAWHPDRNADPRAPEVFLSIQKAYDILKDPVTRAAYDANPWDLNAPRSDLMTAQQSAIENEARNLLSIIFRRHVDGLSIASAKKFDMHTVIHRELTNGISVVKNESRKAYLTAVKLNAIRHRLSKTPFLHQVLREKREANANAWSNARFQTMVAHRALGILLEVDYEADPEPASTFSFTQTSDYPFRTSAGGYSP